MTKKKSPKGKIDLEFGRPARNFAAIKAGAKVAWERPKARRAKKGS